MNGTHRVRRLLLLAMACCAQMSHAAESSVYTEADFTRVEKIDAHVHLHGSVPMFMARAQADGFRLLTINVNYSAFPPVEQQFEDALALEREYPDRVAFAATFDAADSGSPSWLARTQRQLDDALAHGAVAVKVWKDIGMQYRSTHGRAVMIDDARFTPLFRNLERRGIVLLGHQGEPRNAWLPLDAMTTRGDREYFSAHPEYHMFAHPEWPSYEEQLAARDRLLARHPRLKFVALHLASLEWDVERIAAFLKQHPAASIDLAARLVHLKLQASDDPQKVRHFFVAFQDRILYATDLTRLLEQSDAAFAAEAHAVWWEDWRFLSGAAQLRSTEFEGAFHGLGLPREVIDKIYHENARRLFPGAWGGGRDEVIR